MQFLVEYKSSQIGHKYIKNKVRKGERHKY